MLIKIVLLNCSVHITCVHQDYIIIVFQRAFIYTSMFFPPLLLFWLWKEDRKWWREWIREMLWAWFKFVLMTNNFFKLYLYFLYLFICIDREWVWEVGFKDSSPSLNYDKLFFSSDIPFPLSVYMGDCSCVSLVFTSGASVPVCGGCRCLFGFCFVYSWL